MSYKIVITEEAESEIHHAKNWYEERQVGLGESFSATIKEHINWLKDALVNHKIAFKNTGRVLTKRFPFVFTTAATKKK